MTIKTLHIAGWLARVAVGLVLVWSGAVKAARPHELLSSVFQYQLLGPGAAAFVAGVLPFLELVLGLALLCGVWTLGASLIAAMLFMIFTAGQAAALARGIEADCGCFGAGEPISWVSLLRTSALMLGAMVCVAQAVSASRSASRDIAQAWGRASATPPLGPGRPADAELLAAM